jgi:hypothetical protein
LSAAAVLEIRARTPSGLSKPPDRIKGEEEETQTSIKALCSLEESENAEEEAYRSVIQRIVAEMIRPALPKTAPLPKEIIRGVEQELPLIFQESPH